MNVYPVNRPDFCLIRDVRNEVLFQIRDIDRKPVSIADDSLMIAIVDPTSNTLLLTRELLVADSAKGIYQLVIRPGEMDTWLTGPLRWSMVRQSAGESVMLWMDLNYTPVGTVFITEGAIPGPAVTVTADWSSFTAIFDANTAVLANVALGQANDVVAQITG